ncbi:MAG: sulfotransferase [Cyclobacteriaceae bacterium]
MNIVIHIGAMRTASTYLQQIFARHDDIHQLLKTRFFSYDPYFRQGRDYLKDHLEGHNKLIIDSDENYSLGRFKDKLISHTDLDYSFKNELFHIRHDTKEMAKRIRETYPEGKILLVIRNQKQWINSVFKHDIQHFGLDKDFNGFLMDPLGQSYIEAGDFNALHRLYVGLFSSENVKTLLFEDIRKNPTRFFSEISDFLGVTIEPDQNAKKNEARTDHSIGMNRFINRFSQGKKDVKEKRAYYLMRGLSLKLDGIAKKLSPNYKLVDEKDLIAFHAQYENANRELAELLGREEDMRQYGYYS